MNYHYFWSLKIVSWWWFLEFKRVKLSPFKSINQGVWRW